MRTEPSSTSVGIAPPPAFRGGREAPIETATERATSSPRIPASPLLLHLATYGAGSSVPADDEQSLLQLATHQEALFQHRKRALVVDAVRHSPWPAMADADPDDLQARQIMQDARQALHGVLPSEQIEDAEQAADGSHSDFFKEIADLIARLERDWISKYSGLLAGYVAFYKELTNILADLRDQLGKPDKDGMVHVDFTALRGEFDKLRTTWATKGFGEVFGTEAAARQFLAELGIEGLSVVEVQPGGGWQISIDPDLINSLQNVFPADVGPISASALNELMAQKEVMMERFNFINRAMPEKYQRQLQMWDSLVKILSSTIDAVTEADRAFIQALAG
ncbi:IpaD/SipD/SspD family type III secretion system needle tip protein [Stenotrophomonas pennii]|uniref:IpaD/SipD/SspD family type III secretion system needle tip protein n=1 Tax=Stenotrophomonas lacuserhaii TaxID=2760084 RepID=UPI00320B1DC8